MQSSLRARTKTPVVRFRHDTIRSIAVALGLVVALAASSKDARAQSAPIGDHYAGRGADSGYGSGSVSPTGGYSAGVPLDLPPARGGVPIPVSLHYDASNRVGEGGLGWSLSWSYVVRSTSLARRRPRFSSNWLAPVVEPRTTVVLGGQSILMVEAPGGGFRAIVDRQDLLLTEEAGTFVLRDGGGLVYRFEKHPDLDDDELWLLAEVVDSSELNRVRLQYTVTPVQVPSGETLQEVLLTSVRYDYTKEKTCAKHVVAMIYQDDPVAGAPVLGYPTAGGRLRVRTQVLSRIDVLARGYNCGDAPTRLRSYQLRYQPDVDTNLPRLSVVDLYGRDGTPEAGTAVPVARYDYGSATDGHSLSFQKVAPIALPSGEDLSGALSAMVEQKSADADSAYGYYRTWQTLHDFTGDGRPDLIFREHPTGGDLQIAPNRATAGGLPGTALDGAVTPLFPPGLLDDELPLGFQTSTERRNWYHQPITVEELRVQMIDFNADGRTDILEADPGHPEYWTLYLNTPAPGDSTGIEWKVVNLNISKVRNALKGWGVMEYGEPLTLSRSKTAMDIHVRVDWESHGGPWVPANQGYNVRGESRQLTFTDWKLADVNGDGYPDLVANSRRLERWKTDGLDTCDDDFTPDDYYTPDPGPTGVDQISCTYDSYFGIRGDNQLRVFYNRAGALLGTEGVTPFADFLPLDDSDCGVEAWESEADVFPHEHYLDGESGELVDLPPVLDHQWMRCGLAEVNGDGIIDRIEEPDLARLGTGTSFAAKVGIPGYAFAVRSQRSEVCTEGADEEMEYEVVRESALVDLTGDGIPDYLSGSRLYVGTGAGWRDDPVGISTPQGGFSLSTTIDTCGKANLSGTETSSSLTTRGLFDIDGDGRPDLMAAGEGAAELYRITGATGGTGAYDAGRLIRIGNGYGAETRIEYTSAKTDTHTLHQVPFPEIVVSQVSTEVTSTEPLSESLVPTRYAYGDITMRFDGIADRWSSAGYRRRVALRGLPDTLWVTGKTAPFRIRGTASIVDNLVAEGYDLERHATTGRLGDAYALDGVFLPDPWALLEFDPAEDTRWHGHATTSYAVEQGRYPDDGFPFDCTRWDPYLLWSILIDYDGAYDFPCHDYGFVSPVAVSQWRGERAPSVSDHNLTEGKELLSIDEIGRPLRIWYKNDLSQPDDVCEELTYANADKASYHRIFGAVHTRTLRQCVGGRPGGDVLSRVRYRYDDLPEGWVGRGWVTHRIAERYDPSTGDFLGEVVLDHTTHDDFGNVIAISREDKQFDPASGLTSNLTQIDRFEAFDGFGIAPRQLVVSASDVAVELVTTTELDPYTLAASAITDSDGTVWTTTYDGFGRARRSGVIPAGTTAERILAAADFHGFAVGESGGRRIRGRQYHDEVGPADLDVADPTESVTRLDELGRPILTEHGLGVDYDDRVIVDGETRYDRLGRPWFVADPYLADTSEPRYGNLADTSAPRYGTTRLFRDDGTMRCEIRGRGPQTEATTSSAEARFAACTDLVYDDHLLRVRVRGANELSPGSPLYGAYSESVQTAIGRTREQSRWLGNQRLELSQHGYDLLGQQTALVRYRDPAATAEPVVWRMSVDSFGQTVALEEPGAVAQRREYDRRGHLVGTSWNDGVDHLVATTYDGFGRPVSAVEMNDGAVVSGSQTALFYDQPSGDPEHLYPDHLVGRLSHAHSASQDVFFGYDALGRTRAVTRVGDDGVPFTETTDYRIDGALDVLTFWLPDASYQPESYRYGYDSARRVSEIVASGDDGDRSLFQAHQIDAFGRYREIEYGNGVVESHVYNKFDRREQTHQLISTANGVANTYYAGYDANLRLLERVDYSTVGGVVDYRTNKFAFDPLYRLAEAGTSDLLGPVRHHSFGYDGLGNLARIRDLLSGRQTTVYPDSVDRDRVCQVGRDEKIGPQQPVSDGFSTPYVLADPTAPLAAAVPAGDCSYRYDSHGNVASIKPSLGVPGKKLTYDGRGRVTHMSAGGAVANYRYDPLGGVAALDVIGSASGDNRNDRRYGGLVERSSFVIDGAQVSDVIERRIPGPLGVFLARRGAGEEAEEIYWHGDGQANRLFTDHEGNVVQKPDYEPFGELASDSSVAGSLTHTKYLWNGGDTLGGFGLTHLGARLYDPEIGRFLQRDPLLITRTASTTHPYAFAANDPINLSDPSGLDPCGADLCISSGYNQSQTSASWLTGGFLVGLLSGLADHIVRDFLGLEPSAPSFDAPTAEQVVADDQRWQAQFGAWQHQRWLDENRNAREQQRLDDIRNTIRYVAGAGNVIETGTMVYGGTLFGGLAVVWGGPALVQGGRGLLQLVASNPVAPGDLIAVGSTRAAGGTAAAAAGMRLASKVELGGTYGGSAATGAGARVYSSGSAPGSGITLAEAETAAARHGIDTRMVQLQYEAGHFGFGFVSLDGAGNMIRVANGRFALTLTDSGLSSVRAAVETISHELNHIRGWLRTGTVSTEAAAEAAARAARPFIR